MAKSNQLLLSLAILAIVIVELSWLPLSHSAAKKPAGAARKEDIPYIKCQVCQKLASQLYHQVQSKRDEISPKKVSEYHVIEITENLVEQDSEGQCGSECKTIERACQEVLGYYDTDVAEYLYTNKPQLDSLVNFICKDLTKACSSKPPPVPKDRIPGEPFVAKSAKEAEMERLMKSMEGMPGAPGMKMYSREELMNQKFGNEDAEDDEDDDDVTDFPSNLGKVLREKESKKYDWKEKITKGVVDAGEKLKGHADRVSHRIRQWWKSKKANSNKGSKSGKTEL
ncbi:hypothetical protein MIMGU_mgv1a021489mg [Erythranthe guttata]|uniref:Saposin B-type domain-containing protein n=1 Tax=Erythranthe guttata TaxID=4155 RepID=A0A022QSV1_ERYGU|nr:hypothetical protein MIMGU_mgv1a021489mg [Erythranthe guttata]